MELTGYDNVLLAKEILAYMIRISRVNILNIRISSCPHIVVTVEKRNSESGKSLTVYIRDDYIYVEGKENNDGGILTTHSKSIAYGNNAMKEVKRAITAVALILEFDLN